MINPEAIRFDSSLAAEIDRRGHAAIHSLTVGECRMAWAGFTQLVDGARQFSEFEEKHPEPDSLAWMAGPGAVVCKPRNVAVVAKQKTPSGGTPTEGLDRELSSVASR